MQSLVFADLSLRMLQDNPSLIIIVHDQVLGRIYPFGEVRLIFCYKRFEEF